MRKILELILSLVTFWREKEAERIEEEVRIKDEAKESIETIKDLAEPVEHKELDGRIKSVTDKAKDLGILLLMTVCLATAANAQVPTVDLVATTANVQVLEPVPTPPPQTAEDRIRVYSHDELRDYALQLVDLVREQQKIISELQQINAEQDARMRTITAELGVISSALNSLGATRKKSTLMHVADWSLKILPAILGVVAVVQ